MRTQTMTPSAPAVGHIQPPEWREMRVPASGRRLTQLTAGQGHSYPLYYFVPSLTPDGRYMVFHSERSGWVQLYRLDLVSGEIAQLSDGRTSRSGWAIWCERRLRGIYNHISCINRRGHEVYYFQDEEVCAAHLHSLDNHLVTNMPPGRMSIGQSDCSPDGKWLAVIHVDRRRYERALDERETLECMGQFHWHRDHERFRESIGGAVIALIDIQTGQWRTVIELDYHVHHVLFVDDTTLLVNHPRGCKGMWTIDVNGGNIRHLRSADAPGAYGSEVEHQIVTHAGICYDAVREDAAGKAMFVGRCDPKSGECFDIPLPDGLGYTHIGADPAGRFFFVEKSAPPHEILSVHPSPSGGPAEVRTIYTLHGPGNLGQRSHAHPFLSPDRRWMHFTDLSDNGFYQLFRLDVADLVAVSE
jgi:hypothetical protein